MRCTLYLFFHLIITILPKTIGGLGKISQGFTYYLINTKTIHNYNLVSRTALQSS